MKNMSDNRVVAIHQPNFIPWLGYFNKIARSDVFIVLDNVQFPKTGGTWMNRVRIEVDGRPAWLTIPVVRAYHGVRMIRDMQLSDAAPWRSRIVKTIEESYRQAPHFAAVFPFLTEMIQNPVDSLPEFNLAAIRSLVEALGMDPAKLVLGSRLGVEGKATDLLIAMVEAVGGTAYLCGDGAQEYQEDAKFPVAGLRLTRQQFQHPRYPQHNTRAFTPGLSIIDALMNCGFEHTRAMIETPVLTN
jgi:hypothetical protein